MLIHSGGEVEKISKTCRALQSRRFSHLIVSGRLLQFPCTQGHLPTKNSDG